LAVQFKGIANLRHRVTICRQDDIIMDGTDMRLNREGVWQAWADIEAKRASTFSPQGMSMMDNRNQRSHIITARYRDDTNISAMAWIYEERIKSSPRWFKILSVNQTECKGSQFFNFDCRVVERSDTAAKPTHSPAMPLPEGVRL
jgi:hypothetical protein